MIISTAKHIVTITCLFQQFQTATNQTIYTYDDRTAQFGPDFPEEGIQVCICHIWPCFHALLTFVIFGCVTSSHCFMPS